MSSDSDKVVTDICIPAACSNIDNTSYVIRGGAWMIYELQQQWKGEGLKFKTVTTHLETRLFTEMLHNPLLSYTVIGSKAESTGQMATMEYPGP